MINSHALLQAAGGKILSVATSLPRDFNATIGAEATTCVEMGTGVLPFTIVTTFTFLKKKLRSFKTGLYPTPSSTSATRS